MKNPHGHPCISVTVSRFPFTKRKKKSAELKPSNEVIYYDVSYFLTFGAILSF